MNTYSVKFLEMFLGMYIELVVKESANSYKGILHLVDEDFICLKKLCAKVPGIKKDTHTTKEAFDILVIPRRQNFESLKFKGSDAELEKIKSIEVLDEHAAITVELASD